MAADLITRARSASSLEEEALVIFEAVQHSALPVEQRRELCRIVMMAGKEVPRPVLLGVVAALVPDRFAFFINREYERTDAFSGVFHPKMNDGKDVGDWACSGDCYSGRTPRPRTPDRHTGGRKCIISRPIATLRSSDCSRKSTN